MEESEFRSLIAQAIDGLPEEFRQALDNVSVVVDENPSKAQRARFKRRGEKRLLLGLYEGVPRGARGTDYAGVLPDKITLFQAAIEERCGGKRAGLIGELRLTLLHELGHYFGLSDERLRDLGY